MNTKTNLTNKIYFHVLLSLSFAISLVLFRIKLTQSEAYIFLIWNLFLAAIPYLISQTMKNHSWLQSSRILHVVCLGIWLLFLPNSPYIITDIIHLPPSNSNLAWYDLFLVFVFALNGLLLGLLSMFDIFQILAFRYGKKIAFSSILVVSLLTGYGIYLGRFLRFNSWHIITKPRILFHEIIESINDPKAYLITFAFGSLLYMLFYLAHFYSSLYEPTSSKNRF